MAPGAGNPSSSTPSAFGFLRGSSLARYTFLLFTFAALVPVLYIAYLSYERVSQQLREQSLEQSRQLSKSLGMELFRRLDNLSTQLARVAADIQRGADIQAGELDLFASLTLTTPAGGATAVKGGVLAPPTLNDAQLKSLAAQGRTLALVPREASAGDADPGADLVLVRQLDGTGQSLAIAIPTREIVRTLTDLMPGDSELLLAGPQLEVVFQSAPWVNAAMRRLEQSLDDSPSGHFPWSAGPGEQLAAYWSLFTLPELGLEHIVVLVSADESAALAAITRFRSTYLPVLVLVILGVALVTARQLKTRLLPLIELRDATRSISEGQFRVRMHVDTDDEIGDLATAFNEMSARLDHQFSNLEAMAEIDRQILSSFDSRNIVETVVNRAGELTPCDRVCMLEVSADNPGTALLTGRSRRQAPGELDKRSIELEQTDLAVLEQTQQLLLDPSTETAPAFLRAVTGDRPPGGQLLVLPIMIEDQLAAALIFVFEDNYRPGDEDLTRLRKFADHLTVAFANARWESRLYEQAHYDTLTGLPNRTLMLDRLAQALHRSERNNTKVALIFIDLDEFKVVNDSLGHAAGDRLLASCAQRLNTSVRNLDTVARFGGDEFIVIIPDIQHTEGETLDSVDIIARNILGALEASTTIDEVEVETGASLGIALYPEDATTGEELVSRADAAMYSAKAAGRNCYRFYRPEMNEAAIRRLSFKQEIRRALAEDELRLYYQPKHDCSTDELVGAEALIRWQHPSRGLVRPDEFIQLAEQMGCIEELGEWVCKRACTDLANWQAMGLPAIKLSFNVSPRQFAGPKLVPMVRDVLATNTIPPQMIELEITESALMEHPGASIDRLHQLRDIGVALSIDDFGTGYSSLGYLKDLRVDTLKLDRSFITALLDDERVAFIVSTVIKLAHDLKLEVVAEGVEHPDEKALLHELGCDLIQGYLYGRPVPTDEFVALLKRKADRAA